jgi:predicted DNA-binding ribbon-helix-helix protein
MRAKGSRGSIKHVKLGDRAQVYLEEAFWLALKEIAAAQGTSMAQLIRRIDSERRERQHFNLSSATRLFVLDYYRSRCSPEWPDTKIEAALVEGNMG